MAMGAMRPAYGLHGVSMNIDGERILIRGVVQGVGFRPTVWRLANELNINGSVYNHGSSVVVEAWAPVSVIDQLVRRLYERLPPLAKIDSIQRQPLTDTLGRTRFEIVASEGGAVETAVVADAATCPACIAEISDPTDRRYRYAFTNCTHCGPRFSIVKAMPYDRANTSMAAFTMCSACQTEYEDTQDRRFHAQPNACPDCGPRLWLQDSDGSEIRCEDVIGYVAGLISTGSIVAIKGVGGFHLACDGRSETVVRTLRQRKRRYYKPFALLARDVAMIRRFAFINALEEKVLTSPAAPIVLLDAHGETLASDIAPGQRTLGFALPSTPLHHLLMQTLDYPVVFTSGNLSDDPQCIDNADAVKKLSTVADAFLLHDREIVNRVDDSVVRSTLGQSRRFRRARGYAPAATALPHGFENGPAVMAMGAELKSTFCLSRCGQAIVSQHIGDLENAAALADYRRQLSFYQTLYQHRPEIIVIDCHADYLSSQYGRKLADQHDVRCIEVQHHHAHIAAVMAEHELAMESEPVLGIAFDGLGMGNDGSLWGGEFLLVNYRQCRRLASFAPVALLGGPKAMREPWRNTVAQLLHWFDWSTLAHDFADLELIQDLQSKPIDTLRHMAERKLNSPSCSSAGRLFDAVAAALGICRDKASYEGQAAIELETAAETLDLSGIAYPVDCVWAGERWHLAWAPLWRALLRDLQRGVAKGEIAARFHRGLIKATADLTVRLCRAQGVSTVALAGGVMQNSHVLKGVSDLLTQTDIRVLSPSCFPAGDGAISLGQTVVALARL